MRRVRLGLRGSVPDTDQAINYFAAVELGQNAATSDGPALMDASVTFNSPWGPRLRAGQFKLAMMDETLEAVHVSADLIDFLSLRRGYFRNAGSKMASKWGRPTPFATRA